MTEAGACRQARARISPFPLSHFFPQHVFWCRAGEDIVFLDLARDRYLCLPPGQRETFEVLLRNPLAESTALERLCRGLRRAGLLRDLAHTRNRNDPRSRADRPTASHDGTPDITLPSATRTLTAAGSYTPSQRPGPVDGARVIASCLRASASLRFRSLSSTVAAVQQRKARRPSSETTLEQLHSACATFATWRPVYPARHRCLFDSLALLHYLTRYNLDAAWVFGVRTSPFNAHCWLQHGDTVLTDHNLDYIRTFTPILIV